MNGVAQLAAGRHKNQSQHLYADMEHLPLRNQQQPVLQDHGFTCCPAMLVFQALLPTSEDRAARRRRRMGCWVAMACHTAAFLLLFWPLHLARTRVMLPPSSVTIDTELPSGMSSIEFPSVPQYSSASGSRQKQPVRKTTAPSRSVPSLKEIQSRIKPSIQPEMPPPAMNAMLSMPSQSLPVVPSGGMPAVALQASGGTIESDKAGSDSGASFSSSDSTGSSSAASVASIKGARTGSSHGHGAANWQGLLLARLEQFKRYPEEARSRGQQGISYLRFTMDREGHVLSTKIEKSAGFGLLDKEALSLMQRAQPLPKPPPEVQGDHLELVVPIQFFLNER